MPNDPPLRRTVAEGKTFPYKELLKEWGFQWNPTLKLWVLDYELDSNSIFSLSRVIGDTDVTIRNVREDFLADEEDE